MLKLKYSELKRIILQFFSKIKIEKNLKFNVSNFVDSINNDEIEKMIKLIKRDNLSEEAVISLIEKIPEIFLFTELEIMEHLSFIYNSKSLYAVLLCTGNEYTWINYSELDNKFRDKKTIVFDPKNMSIEEDTIIRNLISSTYRKDIIRSANIDLSDPLEQRIYKLKKLKINSNGYRIL